MFPQKSDTSQNVRVAKCSAVALIESPQLTRAKQDFDRCRIFLPSDLCRIVISSWLSDSVSFDASPVSIHLILLCARRFFVNSKPKLFAGRRVFCDSVLEAISAWVCPVKRTSHGGPGTTGDTRRAVPAEILARAPEILSFSLRFCAHPFFVGVRHRDLRSTCLAAPSFFSLVQDPSVRLSVGLYVRSPVCPFVCPSDWMSVRLTICLSFCISVRPSVCLSVCPAGCLNEFCLIVTSAIATESTLSESRYFFKYFFLFFYNFTLTPTRALSSLLNYFPYLPVHPLTLLLSPQVHGSLRQLWWV